MSLKILQRYTDRSVNSIAKYFDDINKYPLLTMDEEVDYAERMKEGDERAKELLISCNLRFVVSVAKQYQNRGLGMEDLINEGNLGLIEAVGKYDHTKGFKLISYAVWYIRRNIQTALMDTERKCKIPHSKVTRMNQLRKLIVQRQNQLEREVTPTDLYGHGDFTDTEIDTLISLIEGSDTSMDKTLDDDGMSFGDLMPSNSYDEFKQDMENNYMSLLICGMVGELSDQEQLVVNHLHGLNGFELLSMTEVADGLGLSRQRIDQIYKKSLATLRESYSGALSNKSI